MKNRINLAWLKRDLRIFDNEVLHSCEQKKIPYQIIYIFEPEIIKKDNISLRHLQFIYHSILDVNNYLNKYNRQIKCLYGSANTIFKEYISHYNIQNIYSYQETGISCTYNRDKKINILLNNNNINFIEFEKDCVQRAIRNRKGWDKRWYSKMNNKVIKNSFTNNTFIDSVENNQLPQNFLKSLKIYPNNFLKPGYKNAIKLLKTFIEHRSLSYNKNISKPYHSRKSCSRISPYLSWGNISSKEVYQFFRNYRKIKGIKGFLTRLKWRSHFIQKFESEYQISFRCANKAFENMTYTNDIDLLNKWKKGKTGFPLVDANMHCLRVTGWINFRMRAMLVSVLVHHFDCDWKLGVRHLAELFLDYEPGIHYSQFQMQSGTTGINTIRMYNPIKQSYDHDMDGKFIKKWIPELKEVSAEYIHEPWKIPPLLSTLEKDSIYNSPCLDISIAGKKARNKIWSFKSNEEVKIENKRILQLHTRNSII
ncbi:MAG: deoxyribodipyrimidine photolyase [Candidatus Marinimicrobia bacterium]|nr:deoxyribodipyrimidine photolyase [Candidatus Neomarinimicrobiota bacterium]